MISEAAIKVFELAASMCSTEEELKKWIGSEVNRRTIDSLEESDKVIFRGIYAKARDRLRYSHAKDTVTYKGRV